MSELGKQVARAAKLPGYDGRLDSVTIRDARDLAGLPVLRKSDLVEAQAAHPPFGGFTTSDFAHVFQSPGPIYEPGQLDGDWWRFGPFLTACGIGPGDVVQNCFSYHLTPAGLMLDCGARAVGATVLPAGTGQTELQVRAAAHLGVTAYAGTPDYLKVILERADGMGVKLKITKAAVSGGALFPSLRAYYADRGITCRQCYGTADIGQIAYEDGAREGMAVAEGVIVELVTPGTGDPVSAGEVGEIVVTTLNPDYPLVRFATGDMSQAMETGKDGRALRIRGWMGRADQTTKIKGMFVRPEQVAELVRRHDEIDRVRVIADRQGDADRMIVRIETADPDVEALEKSVTEVLKLKGEVERVAPGGLPRDGVVIEDRRVYET